MSQWLYNAKGRPVAFVSGDCVYSRRGRFVGRLEGSEVWHGRYKGEIVQDDRFLYDRSKGSVVRGTPGTPGSPGVPGMPGNTGAIGLTSRYRDVELE
jgi:hypothetical protein